MIPSNGDGTHHRAMVIEKHHGATSNDLGEDEEVSEWGFKTRIMIYPN